MQMNRTTTQLARPQTFQVQNNSKCGTRYRRDPAGRYLDSLRRDPVLFDWINSFEIISCSNGLVSSSTAVAPLPEQNLLSDCLSPDPFNLSPKLRLRMNAESGGLADPAQRWPPIFSHTCCQMAPKEGPWQMDGPNKSRALFTNLLTQGGPEASLSPCQQHPSLRFRISCSSYCCPCDYSIDWLCNGHTVPHQFSSGRRRRLPRNVKTQRRLSIADESGALNH